VEAIVKTSLLALTLGSILVANASDGHADVAISVGGHVSVGGAIGVVLGAPFWHHHHRHGAAVVVGGGVYAYGYGEFAEPPPPPPADPCCCCEAPPPPPVYYSPPPVYTAPPESQVVVVHQPRPRRFGLGARVSTTQLSAGEMGPESDGIGGLMRLRGSRAELELEVGQEHFRHLDRTDTRLGATAYLHLTGGRLRPYLLLGAGLNMIDNYYGRQDQEQGYLEGGGGLQLRFGQSFSLNGDLRWSSRKHLNDDEAGDYHLLTVVPEKETGFEGRLAAVFYF
jgi:hypothetical protein